MNVKQKYNIEISYHQKCKINAIFVEIGKVLNEVNGTRKRMISINFIMRRIFNMMGIPHKQIPISKSKKTLAFYNRYWVSIMSLIGDKIKSTLIILFLVPLTSLRTLPISTYIASILCF